MNITIFGGAQPTPGEPTYQEAYDLGKLLAEAGHAILTGGYIGTMEAASRGAAESGGHVIGVTCDEIEAWRDIHPNAWIKEERRFKTLQERLNTLIDGCDAAIALPGGVGTLAEIALNWNLMSVKAMPEKPLILVGAGWQAVFDQFFRSFESYTPFNQGSLLLFAPDVEAAVKLLREHSASNILNLISRPL